MSEAMLGVGSLAPARCCREPEKFRWDMLLPFSGTLSASPAAPCPGSPPPGDLKTSSASRCRLSRSWADAGAELGTLGVEGGGFWKSEVLEGCGGAGLEELEGWRSPEDWGESEDKDESLSKHNT